MCDKCHGMIKPDVVLYEEPLDERTINLAISAIMTCDTLIIVGTSLTVYPAAGFIRYFNGKYLVLLNKSSTQYDSIANIHQSKSKQLGDPVLMTSGQYRYDETDMTISAGNAVLELGRHYQSGEITGDSIGRKWFHSLDTRIILGTCEPS